MVRVRAALLEIFGGLSESAGERCNDAITGGVKSGERWRFLRRCSWVGHDRVGLIIEAPLEWSDRPRIKKIPLRCGTGGGKV